MKRLEIGCYPATVTPFSEQGDFMADAFAEILRWHIACGSKGFLIAGDNGENWTLDLKELREITEIAMREADGRPVYVGAWAITEREAIERANNTCYGLSAGVWTDKGSKIFKIAAELKAGVIWANTYNKFDPASPFGGYKESGFGREGGLQGLAAYVDIS